MLFEPLELVEKLAALVPPLRFNLVRYHGVAGEVHNPTTLTWDDFMALPQVFVAIFFGDLSQRHRPPRPVN